MAHANVPGSKGPSLPVNELTDVEGDAEVDLHDDHHVCEKEQIAEKNVRKTTQFIDLAGQKRTLHTPESYRCIVRKSKRPCPNISDRLFKRLHTLESYRCYIPVPGSLPKSHLDYHEFVIGPEYSVALLENVVPSWARAPWLRFRQNETWVQDLITCVARINEKAVRYHFVAKVRSKLQDAIEQARKDAIALPLNERLSALSVIEIRFIDDKCDVYPLTVYNDKNSMAFLLGEKFATFMRKVLVPMAVQSCREIMPDIPDKVVWDVAGQMWVVQVLQPHFELLFDDSLEFKVHNFTDDSLEFKVHNFTEKLPMYRQAILAWNYVDGSMRPRIKPVWLLEHTSGPYAGDSDKLLEATLIVSTRPHFLRLTSDRA